MMRSNSLVRVVALAAAVLTASACADRKESPTAPAPVQAPAPEMGTVAYLTISESAPAAGRTVTVSAYAAGNDVTFGSFAARLSFAEPGLTYVGEAGDAAGMRAVNPKAGDVAIAGVNLEGFADGQLFSVELRVADPKALATLALSVSELTRIDYTNERPALKVQKAVRLARAR